MNPVIRQDSTRQNRNQVPAANQKATPGGNLRDLADRGRSASRVEGSRRFDGLSKMNSALKAPYLAKDLSIRNLKQSLTVKGNVPTQLQELSLRLANLTHLQGSIFLAPHHAGLKQVDIRNNRLSDLPGEICTLSHLTHLRLDYNYLQALPFSLGNLRGLQYLSASQNRLLELPDSLFHHSSRLQTLLVNDNKIGAVQKSLGSLANLK